MEALIYKGLEGVGFTETNPDKGTKTSYLERKKKKGMVGLQKLTPIRGRKQEGYVFVDADYSFTETNPDKGTKTIP